jgi:hypothetical protein
MLREWTDNPGHRGGRQKMRLNPADPFMVRGASVQAVVASPEQRQTLQRLRDAGRWLPRQELPPDVLASLLHDHMVALYGDRVELTTLGALALASSVRNQRSP